MSRGLGDLQRTILAHIDASSGSVTVESLRWLLYEKLEKPPISDDGTLPIEWSTSVARAIKNLASAARLVLLIDKRPLASLEECVTHYPGKTLLAASRRQRLELLPALLQWTREKNGPFPHYTSAENEDYFAARLPEDRARRLREEWVRLESLIRPSFADSGSDEMFLLLVKGRSLFRQMDVSSHCSFAEMVKRCCTGDILPGPVAIQLRDFSQEFLSGTAVGSLQLKSFVHEFAHVARHGPCSLREDTMDLLYERRKDFVESLPGFARNKSNRSLPLQHSTALRRLFDQTVFQKFNFVRRVA